MPTLPERILGRMGAVTKAELDTQVSEAFQKGYQEAAADYAGDGGEDEPISGTTTKYGYRKTARGLRDFTQIDRERILEIVWTLFQSNPVADRAMEIKRDYILGRGITYQARDEGLQKVLDDFWQINKMDRRLKEFTLQLFLFGVQMLTVFVRNQDGRVRLGYIDPAEIEEVIPHPENAMEMWAVIVKAQTAMEQWQAYIPQRAYRIVRQEENLADQYQDWLKNWSAAKEAERDSDEPGEPVHPFDQNQDGDETTDPEGKLVTAGQARLEEWEEKMLQTFGLEEYSGSCFYIKINSVSNQPWGYSDLLQVADWLDQQDETLFALAEREQWANFFSWDVTLKGGGEADVKRRGAELQSKAPRRGTVNVHNEAEAWRMDYPSLQQSGSIETSRAIQNHAFGGLGFPEAWFGRGDETNRATLQAQGDPTWRTLEHDQDAIRDMVLDLLHFVRDQAELAGHWKPGQDQELDLDELEQLAAGGSSNGRFDSGQNQSTARWEKVRGLEQVPDVGAKMAGKIIQAKLGGDEDSKEPDSKIDLDTVESTDPREITVTMPEMTARDLSLVAGMLSTVAGALVVGEEQGWQDKAKSVEIWAKALAEFGIKLDVAAVQQALERKQAEQERDQERDPFTGTAMARHGVMVAGDDDDEEMPTDWEQMSPEQREAVLEAFFWQVGVDRVPEGISPLIALLPDVDAQVSLGRSTEGAS